MRVLRVRGSPIGEVSFEIEGASFSRFEVGSLWLRYVFGMSSVWLRCGFCVAGASFFLAFVVYIGFGMTLGAMTKPVNVNLGSWCLGDWFGQR